MAKKAFEAIMAGIEDAVAYAKGNMARAAAPPLTRIPSNC
jgi:citrate lyase beta subunit